MTEPMSEAEITAGFKQARDAAAAHCDPEAFLALDRIEAELRRLRAELAARPGPIGYVAAVKVHAPYTGTTWLCEDRP